VLCGEKVGRSGAFCGMKTSVYDGGDEDDDDVDQK
jgi:hypothetical protein